MSKKLPYQPPQQDIKDFHPGSSLYGNLALSPPYELPPEKIKPWMSSITHQEEIPMPPEGVAKLKAAMAPHKDWQIPEPAEGSQAPAVPAPVPAPAPKAKEKGKNKKNKKDASAAGKGGSSAPGPSFSRGGAGSSGSAVASQRKGRTSALNRSAKPVPKGKQTVAKSKVHGSLRPHAPHAASKAKALKKPAKAPASPKFKAPRVRAAAAHPQAHPRIVAKAPSRSAPPKKQPIKSREQGKRPHRR
ncbi:hypothetical protein BDN70DRAFT_877833 [Pholiota conissans]|uniref:Uncharacterized protein n=1 Tax=Pholiota conissans TaxID=109636 RepID=A0A9P5Z4R3_9AGAR|nr:hypothetical protein BDN70DRAFT_877833 [Pholiota conissans]